jgi:glucokinase
LSSHPFAERPILAVDLGGTKLAVAVVSPRGELLAELQEPTCQDGPQAGIEQIVRMARTLLDAREIIPLKVEAVGVGIPAVLERNTDFVIWGPNLNGWRDVALRPALEVALGLPIFVEYDGHTAVLAEYWLGAGKGFHSVVDVIIGTGIGGGMILEDRLVRGFNRLAGAAGWFVLADDPNLRDERAHSIGFWEATAAGPGLALQAQAALSLHSDSLLAHLTHPLTAVDIFTAAEQGDPLATQLLERLAAWLGLGIANIVSLVNPEVVILGGGVGSQCAHLLPSIQEIVQRWGQPISARAVQLKISSLGGQAGLFGAAYAASLRLRERTDGKEEANSKQ